jgi:hypothetical protein
LYLITDEQDLVLGTQLADLMKVSLGWDDDSCLSLNGFDEERGDTFAMQLKRSSNVIDLAISDSLDRIAVAVRRAHALEVRPESIPALRICAHAAPHSLHRHVTDGLEG